MNSKETRESDNAMPEEGVLVSVIIVCYNSRNWLPKCLASLEKQSIFQRSEVILVDNASKDGTEQLARELTAKWPKAQVIQAGDNLGFGAGNNRGAEAAKGKYLYLLNPDTWLEPDCLEQFVLAAERENAGCASGLVLEYEDNRIQARGCVGFDFCGNGIEPAENEIPTRLFCIHGFFFIRKDLYLLIGSMDAEFFMYGEEQDVCWRVWIAGDKVVPAYAARVHHRGAAYVNPAGGTKIVENRTSTNIRFFANRNSLLAIAKNCQHVLLLMLLPNILLILLEGVFVLLVTRKLSIARRVSLDVFADCWRLRHHVLMKRREIRNFRRHGDFWLLRLFRLGFGRSYEVLAFFKRGLPKFNQR